jgi:hypothetical protein
VRRAHAAVAAALNSPDADLLTEHARPRLRWRNPSAATSAASGRAIGWSGFGPLRQEAVGRSARITQTRAGRPPIPLAVKIYRAVFLATLGCVGFAMFWLVLQLGSG